MMRGRTCYNNTNKILLRVQLKMIIDQPDICAGAAGAGPYYLVAPAQIVGVTIKSLNYQSYHLNIRVIMELVPSNISEGPFY